jgi:hypothetical protein
MRDERGNGFPKESPPGCGVVLLGVLVTIFVIALGATRMGSVFIGAWIGALAGLGIGAVVGVLVSERENVAPFVALILGIAGAIAGAVYASRLW